MAFCNASLVDARSHVAQQAVAFLFRRTVDHVMAFAQHRQQLGNLLGRILQIVVNGDDEFAAGRADAAQQGVVLAVVAAHAQAAHTGVAGTQALDHAPGIVAAAILDEHDLEAQLLRLEHGLQALVQHGQDRRRAVDRHQHGELRRGQRRCGRHQRVASGAASSAWDFGSDGE
jgi:hypothetical protein